MIKALPTTRGRNYYQARRNPECRDYLICLNLAARRNADFVCCECGDFRKQSGPSLPDAEFHGILSLLSVLFGDAGPEEFTPEEPGLLSSPFPWPGNPWEILRKHGIELKAGIYPAS